MTPEIEKLIDAIASAKTSLLIAAHQQPADRGPELVRLEEATKALASWRDAQPTQLPDRLLIEIRACELGLERLRGASA